MRSQWLAGPAGPPWSATARVKPRTRPSPTLSSRWARARSRPAPRPVRSGSPSTTGSSASRRSLARPLSTSAARPWPASSRNTRATKRAGPSGPARLDSGAACGWAQSCSSQTATLAQSSFASLRFRRLVIRRKRRLAKEDWASVAVCDEHDCAQPHAAPESRRAGPEGPARLVARVLRLDAGQGLAAEVESGRAKLLLDAEEPVVLGDPLRTGRGAGLDLARAHRDDKVGDGRVLGFTRAVADHGGPAGPASHCDRIDRFGDCADLVELDQDRVGGRLADATGDEVRIGHEEIVAHKLGLRPQSLGQLSPTGPVVLAEAVLEGDDRILGDPLLPEVDELAGVKGATLALEAVLPGHGAGSGPFDQDRAGRRIESDRHLVARLVAGLFDGPKDDLNRGLIRRQRRRETALVTLAD